MEFRLIYRGPLDTTSKQGVQQKQDIRRKFHPQLKELWSLPPLASVEAFWKGPEASILHSVGPFTFLPLISQGIQLVARLDVLLLRPREPGSLIMQGGDIDNQLKILFDALRMPQTTAELPQRDLPSNGEQPHFYCLLEDDALITEVSATTDRLLAPSNTNETLALIRVRTKTIVQIYKNIGL